MRPTKNKTVGVSPKVPTQAIVSVVTFLLAYFGVDLSPEASAAIAAVLGVIGGAVAQPGETRPA
jgi:hypothetical protein